MAQDLNANSKGKTDHVHLKRRLGLAHGVAMILGLVIGSGIYVMPSAVLRGTGSPGLALVLWASSGLFGMLGALTFVELGTTFPKSGEKYAYLDEMYGPLVPFLYIWQYLLFNRPGSNAIKCLIFARFLMQLLFPDCEAPIHGVKLVAILLACLLTFVNIVNVGMSARCQVVTSSLTIVALLTMITLGLRHLGQGHTEHLQNAFEGTNTDVGDVFLGLYACIFSTWGWNALNFMVEELKDPYKNLPRASVISMIIVTVLYTLVNASYIAVLGTEGVMTSTALAVSFAQRTLGPGAWVISLAIAINTAGSFNSGTWVGSRLTFVGARRGQLPAVLSLVHIKYLSPITSLLFQLFLVILMIVTGEMYSLLNNMIFGLNLFDVLCCAGLIYLRHKQPSLPRPIKMPLIIPILYGIFMIIAAGVPLITKPKATCFSLSLVLLSGVAYYIICVKEMVSLTFWEKYSGAFLRAVQKALFCVPQEVEIHQE